MPFPATNYFTFEGAMDYLDVLSIFLVYPTYYAVCFLAKIHRVLKSLLKLHLPVYLFLLMYIQRGWDPLFLVIFFPYPLYLITFLFYEVSWKIPPLYTIVAGLCFLIIWTPLQVYLYFHFPNSKILIKIFVVLFYLIPGSLIYYFVWM